MAWGNEFFLLCLLRGCNMGQTDRQRGGFFLQIFLFVYFCSYTITLVIHSFPFGFSETFPSYSRNAFKKKTYSVITFIIFCSISGSPFFFFWSPFWILSLLVVLHPNPPIFLKSKSYPSPFCGFPTTCLWSDTRPPLQNISRRMPATSQLSYVCPRAVEPCKATALAS